MIELTIFSGLLFMAVVCVVLHWCETLKCIPLSRVKTVRSFAKLRADEVVAASSTQNTGFNKSLAKELHEDTYRESLTELVKVDKAIRTSKRAEVVLTGINDQKTVRLYLNDINVQFTYNIDEEAFYIKLMNTQLVEGDI